MTARTRRRQRGAAAVEGLAVIIVMAIVMACLWGVVSVMRVKMAVMEEARQKAWTAALHDCQGTDSTLDDLAGKTGQAESDAMPSTQQVDKYLDVGTTSLATDSGYVSVSRKKSVSFPKMIGGTTYEMHGSMYIRCNEPAPPENATDFFKTAFSVVKYSFDF